MKDSFVRIIACIAVVAAVTLGMILCVAGGIMEGWWGAFLILCSLLIYILLLWIYNHRYK